MNDRTLDWVFAYGSNMNLADVRRWLVERQYRVDGVLRVEPATLPGYKLVWNYYSRGRASGAANVEPCTDRDLPGLALQVDAATLAAIDRKEGRPQSYDRGSDRLTVRLRKGEDIAAWVYVAVPSKRQASPVPPCRSYLQLLVDAAREHSLPHLAELEATRTSD
jgi:hypothetical protein